MNAKQILEEAGLENTYWGEVIIQAEEREGFTIPQRVEASDWVTCACGQHDLPKELYYNYGKNPRDSILGELGEEFDFVVHHDKFVKAAQTLIAIENRVKELLQEMK